MSHEKQLHDRPPPAIRGRGAPGATSLAGGAPVSAAASTAALGLGSRFQNSLRPAALDDGSSAIPDIRPSV
jgi:hypothetical protein